jgi:two-component system, chemotaxis family, sensor kinase CheA
MSTERISRLRERIDDLATRVLLADAGAGCATAGLEGLCAALARIGEGAGEAGCEETARLARGLAGTARSPDALREGIMRLQQALEEDAGRPAPAPTPNPLAQDAELIADFVLESREHLAGIEKQCLALEQDPANPEAVHSLFRGFHTIKGLAGFLELPAILEVAHEVETVLDLARNGQLAIAPAVIDLILESRDYLTRAVAAVETGNPDGGAGEAAPLLERVRALAAAGPAPAEPARPAVLEEPVAEASLPKPARGKAVETFSVRVDTSKLDYLMDMVGEMVIAQSLVRHDPLLAKNTEPNLLRNLAQLTRVTGEVQRTTMAMRMIPIAQLFSRMARLVRDLSRKTGKRVELETAGDETEVDKTIAEELADPLMHMVRNSIDHGIEAQEERAASGKPPVARVRLSACHQGGQIVVEIADDGRGLDRVRILKKAREKGLVESETLTDAEVFNLIFEPGFSTAERVTGVSGRGVGMDVVRKHIQKLRGRIDVESERGRGTRILLKLPLTLAIIDGLVVGVGDTRYIVPIHSVKEIFRPTGDSVFTVRGQDEMAMVHERLLPVVRFHRRFGVRPRHEDPCQALMIVAESDGTEFCLMVDELLGRQEVVIKSLGETFKKIRGIAGGAILGDGRVGLIVDMDAVFGRGGDD